MFLEPAIPEITTSSERNRYSLLSSGISLIRSNPHLFERMIH
uniref:Uncharacterized protein n=1 Tax=Picea glauca TaxID=3330 RepID=A0A101M5B1_PICGL|nr:hypothetical protein ABT39_MTgene1127 [Picea glauca]QHR87466.1 hypothetical protein Q903MT_gene1477 [Picea sitchensis]